MRKYVLLTIILSVFSGSVLGLLLNFYGCPIFKAICVGVSVIAGDVSLLVLIAKYLWSRK